MVGYTYLRVPAPKKARSRRVSRMVGYLRKWGQGGWGTRPRRGKKAAAGSCHIPRLKIYKEFLPDFVSLATFLAEATEKKERSQSHRGQEAGSHRGQEAGNKTFQIPFVLRNL
eukprot:763965-Hanusia_phi.AAC.1